MIKSVEQTNPILCYREYPLSVESKNIINSIFRRKKCALSENQNAINPYVINKFNIKYLQNKKDLKILYHDFSRPFTDKQITRVEMCCLIPVIGLIVAAVFGLMYLGHVISRNKDVSQFLKTADDTLKKIETYERLKLEEKTLIAELVKAKKEHAENQKNKQSTDSAFQGKPLKWNDPGAQLLRKMQKENNKKSTFTKDKIQYIERLQKENKKRLEDLKKNIFDVFPNYFSKDEQIAIAKLAPQSSNQPATRGKADQNRAKKPALLKQEQANRQNTTEESLENPSFLFPFESHSEEIKTNSKKQPKKNIEANQSAEQSEFFAFSIDMTEDSKPVKPPYKDPFFFPNQETSLPIVTQIANRSVDSNDQRQLFSSCNIM